jgi:hypothetical protein
MNTATLDKNTMTHAQIDAFIASNIKGMLSASDDISKQQMIADQICKLRKMSNETVLRIYGATCSADAMAWAANTGSANDADRICAFDMLVDAISDAIEARGYVSRFRQY